MEFNFNKYSEQAERKRLAEPWRYRATVRSQDLQVGDLVRLDGPAASLEVVAVSVTAKTVSLVCRTWPVPHWPMPEWRRRLPLGREVEVERPHRSRFDGGIITVAELEMAQEYRRRTEEAPDREEKERLVQEFFEKVG